jgi:hypothetical protein
MVYPIVLNANPQRLYRIIDGWKRFVACKQLGQKFIFATFQNYGLGEEREQHMLLNLRRAEMGMIDMINSLSKIKPCDLGLEAPLIRQYPEGKEAKVPHKITMLLKPDEWTLHEKAKSDFNRTTSEIYVTLLKEHYNG